MHVLIDVMYNWKCILAILCEMAENSGVAVYCLRKMACQWHVSDQLDCRAKYTIILQINISFFPNCVVIVYTKFLYVSYILGEILVSYMRQKFKNFWIFQHKDTFWILYILFSFDMFGYWEDYSLIWLVYNGMGFIIAIARLILSGSKSYNANHKCFCSQKLSTA